jgi:hypothetical protein
VFDQDMCVDFLFMFGDLYDYKFFAEVKKIARPKIKFCLTKNFFTTDLETVNQKKIRKNNDDLIFCLFWYALYAQQPNSYDL